MWTAFAEASKKQSLPALKVRWAFNQGNLETKKDLILLAGIGEQFNRSNFHDKGDPVRIFLDIDINPQILLIAHFIPLLKASLIIFPGSKYIGLGANDASVPCSIGKNKIFFKINR